MATFLQPRYNGYRYVDVQDMPDTLSDALAAKLRVDTPSGVDGDFTAGGLVAARRFSIEGTLTVPTVGVVQTDAGSFRAAADTLKQIHAPGSPQPFSVDSDRYLMAEVENIDLQKWFKGLPNLRYQIGFRASDPFWYAGTLAGDTMQPNLSVVALNAGAAPSPALATAQAAAPTVAPTVAAAAGATALAAGTYTVAYSYRDAYGETVVSPTSTVTITAGQQINVTALTGGLPSGVNIANLYVSVAAGLSTLAWVQTWNGTGTANITALPTYPNSQQVSPAGNAYSLPVFSIAVTAAPSTGLVYLIATNAAGTVSWAMVLAPTSTATYTVDCTRSQELVSLAGVDTTNIMQGVFPRLAAGGNVVTVGVSGGAAVGACTVSWQDRWY